MQVGVIARSGDEVCGAVIVAEERAVAAHIAVGIEVTVIYEIAVRRVAGCDAASRIVIVLSVFVMCPEDELACKLVVKHLWALDVDLSARFGAELKSRTDAEILARAVYSEDMIAEFPGFEVCGTVAGNVVSIRSVLAVPIVKFAVADDVSAVRMKQIAVCVVNKLTVFHVNDLSFFESSDLSYRHTSCIGSKLVMNGGFAVYIKLRLRVSVYID